MRDHGPERHAPWEHHDEALPIDPDLDPSDPGEPSPTHRPTAPVHRARQHGVVAAIFVGGCLGTACRYGVSVAWPAGDAGFPVATWVINTSGAFALGLLLTLVLERFHAPRSVQPFAATGFLGAWTTMSTLAVEVDTLVRHHHAAMAIGYVTATLVAGTTACLAGIAMARQAVEAPA